MEKFEIKTLGDFDSASKADKYKIVRKFWRLIISENNKALRTIVANDFMFTKDEKVAYVEFFNHFNNTFVKPAFEGYGEVGTPYHKLYYHTYRDGISKYGSPAYYRACIKNALAEVESELKHMNEYHPYYQGKMELKRKYSEILNNSSLIESNTTKIKNLLNEHKPIEMANLRTLVAFVEYQRAFIDYYYNHKPQGTIHNAEDVKKYMDKFYETCFTQSTSYGAKFREHYTLPCVIPVVDGVRYDANKDGYVESFKWCMDMDNISSLYDPYSFGVVAKCELDWRNAQLLIKGDDLTQIELNLDLPNDKIGKMRARILKYTLNIIAKHCDNPEQALVHIYPVDIIACEEDYSKYCDKENEAMASDYFNYGIERDADLTKREEAKIRKRAEEEIDIYDEEYNELALSPYTSDTDETLYYDENRNLVYKDGTPYRGREVQVIDESQDCEKVTISNPYYEDSGPEIGE